MADVADGAGLSRGIVNFHFESKEKLLDRNAAVHVRRICRSLAQCPGTRAAMILPGQLRALVASDFDRAICNKRKLAAWCAFWGEAKSRPTYQALCGARDEAYQNVFIDLCRNAEGRRRLCLRAAATALALSAMLEGLWLRLMMGTEDVTRESACSAASTSWRPSFQSIIRGPDGRQCKTA